MFSFDGQKRTRKVPAISTRWTHEKGAARPFQPQRGWAPYKKASRFAKTGCGAQRPLRALSGTRVLLTAAPTAPPCIRRWRRSSPLHFFLASPIDRPLSRCGGSSPQGSGGEPAPKQKPAAVSQSEKTAAGMGGLYRYAVRLRSPPRCRSSSTSAAFPFPPGWAGAGSSRCRRRRWHSLRSPADAPGTLPPAQSPARRGRSPGRSS